MTTKDYLTKVLASQTLADDSDELKALQEQRAKVEQLLRDRFKDSSPTIRYGGSKAKGTMIRDAYDLDIVCYFPHDDTSAGETLEDIYNNVRTALATAYVVEPKGSALRLKDSSEKTRGVDFHIDVVPGRFTDDKKSDAFLYRSTGEKKRLKTNLDVHIKHVKDSGVIEAIRLVKLWKVRNGLSIKNFVLELAVIKLLNGTIKGQLAAVGQHTLAVIGSSGWEAVFGPVDEKKGAEKTEALRRAAAAVVTPTRPWLKDASILGIALTLRPSRKRRAR